MPVHKYDWGVTLDCDILHPRDGDIVYGYRVGRVIKNRYIRYRWTKCSGCSSFRWAIYPRKGLARVCRSCAHKAETGELSHGWKGGRHLFGEYIVRALYPDDIFYSMGRRSKRSTPRRLILEHRLIMAQYLGRCLDSWEVVHHKGTMYPIGSKDDKKDNRIENLELVTPSQHSQYGGMQKEIIRLRQEVARLTLVLEPVDIDK